MKGLTSSSHSLSLLVVMYLITHTTPADAAAPAAPHAYVPNVTASDSRENDDTTGFQAELEDTLAPQHGAAIAAAAEAEVGLPLGLEEPVTFAAWQTALIAQILRANRLADEAEQQFNQEQEEQGQSTRVMRRGRTCARRFPYARPASVSHRPNQLAHTIRTMRLDIQTSNAMTSHAMSDASTAPDPVDAGITDLVEGLFSQEGA